MIIALGRAPRDMKTSIQNHQKPIVNEADKHQSQFPSPTDQIKAFKAMILKGDDCGHPFDKRASAEIRAEYVNTLRAKIGVVTHRSGG